ncbi:MAG TPA: hypothetical protein VFJ09_04615 [Nocardioidaceae bacterium]|nr:hypothetical protein [Nocardioidaceae bacterium]
MHSSEAVGREPRDLLPWFRSLPELTVLVIVALFAGVFVLRITTGTAMDATNMLYTLPIALAALSFGRRAGLLAGLGAVALVLAWVLIDSVDLTVFGWFSRVVPMLLLGLLLGDASDRLRRANERGRRLEAAAQRHRDAVEINDTLVQGMVAARWSFEAGRHAAGLQTLDQTIALGQDLVTKLMRESDMGINGHRGRSTEQQARA